MATLFNYFERKRREGSPPATTERPKDKKKVGTNDDNGGHEVQVE